MYIHQCLYRFRLCSGGHKKWSGRLPAETYPERRIGGMCCKNVWTLEEKEKRKRENKTFRNGIKQIKKGVS